MSSNAACDNNNCFFHTDWPKTLIRSRFFQYPCRGALASLGQPKMLPKMTAQTVPQTAKIQSVAPVRCCSTWSVLLESKICFSKRTWPRKCAWMSLQTIAQPAKIQSVVVVWFCSTLQRPSWREFLFLDPKITSKILMKTIWKALKTRENGNFTFFLDFQDS